MAASAQKAPTRWPYLLLGVISMLFAGIIYAWSILKAPLESEFGWSVSGLALNFTLTMCFFCVGGLLGGILSKRVSPKPIIIISGLVAGVGFLLTARLSGENIVALYITYGVMAGLGIGAAYNVILSTVSAWFPDKKGTCSGALLMGFGASALVLGSLAGSMIEAPTVGWRGTYTLLGIALAVVMVITGLILRRPAPGTAFPQPKASQGASSQESFEARDYTTGEMAQRFTFWRAFICIIFLAAVGNSVISFALDLSLSVGASVSLATTLVGVLSVCNGLGRIITGALFDSAGRRVTMVATNLLTIVAAGVTLVSILTSSLPLCIIGLCLTGLSYGSCPTVSAAFVSAFYGTKYYATNFALMNFNLMGASFMATASSALFTATSGYLVPFIMLLALSVVALLLNLSIRRP